MIDTTAIIQLVGFVVSVAAAAVWLKSALVKQRHEELESLAETRGRRIEDLKAQVDRQGAEIDQLRSKIKAVEDLLTSAIADRVANKVISHLENQA